MQISDIAAIGHVPSSIDHPGSCQELTTPPIEHETRSMATKDDRSVVLEVVAMRLCLRVGHEVVITTEIDANAMLQLRAAARSFAVRRGISFVDMTRN
jgi:hypothetical protein